MMNSFLEKLRQTVGPGGMLLGEDVANRSDSWPPEGGCQAKAILRPCCTEEISEILTLCHAQGQSIVTHGGLTGLVGGALTSEDDIVLSMERMNDIEVVDTINRTMTVKAGVPLQKVHEAAEEAGLLFPLDLGARGTATIGGNIATNAGGNSVIRYGMIRDQILGVEAVLADGTIISSLKGVIKNNTGYDLKQLFIGSEGTLGIVTRAVLRLRPLPRSRNTALVAIEDFDRLGRFLGNMDSKLGGILSAFEVMWNSFYQLVVVERGTHGQPLGPSHEFYVLVESTGGHEKADKARFEGALEAAFEEGLLVDAVIAQSEQQRADFWAIRDDVGVLAAELFPPLKYDISLSIPQIEGYVDAVRQQLTERWPESRMIVFGHLGDGNIHLVLTIGTLEEIEVQAAESIIYEELGRREGVISAEHGIGLQKREYLKHSRSEAEIALMKTIKHALDPKGILNPDRIFAQPKETQP
jgi:FAD/FMN-containing dehydrogenase